MKHTTLKKALCLAFALPFWALSSYAQATIHTIAGTGASGTSGDGGLATAATLSYPNSAVADHSGNVYIIGSGGLGRKIAADGTISSFSISSMLSPQGAWCDNAGRLFITDGFHDDVHMYDPSTGTLMRMCGDGTQGTTGDGDSAIYSKMLIPAASCVDHWGNLYVADRGSSRVRKVTASTGIINTIAGTGSSGFSGDGGLATAAQLSNPTGVAVDMSGNVYISDNGNHRIRKINAATGIITTIAGTGTVGNTGDNGPAISATINSPQALYVDTRENLFFADMGNNNVRVVNNFGYMQAVAGNGTMGFSGDGGAATAAQLSSPSSVWMNDNGALLIADKYNNRIRLVTAAYYTVHRDASGALVNDMNASVSVFPNPSTDGNINLIVGNDMVNGTYEVVNAVGQSVMKGNIAEVQNQIVLNQPSGIYFMNVHSTAGNTSIKFTIAK